MIYKSEIMNYKKVETTDEKKKWGTDEYYFLGATICCLSHYVHFNNQIPEIYSYCGPVDE